MIRRRIRKLQRAVDNSIMGAYLKGVAKDVAIIDSDMKLRSLGESFCRFKDKTIDLTSSPLVNMNNFKTAPNAGGVVSNMITDINEKIKSFSEGLILRGYDNDTVMQHTKGYAKKLQDAGVRIAYGEGEEDKDLKEDVRVLLKEGKNEFIKREQEEAEEVEEAAPENQDGDAMMMEEEMPMDDMGGEEMPMDDFGGDIPEGDKGMEGPTDEEMGDDYQAMADQQSNEMGMDMSDNSMDVNVDVEIPTGSFESYNVGEAFSWANLAEPIRRFLNGTEAQGTLNIVYLLDNGYKIKGIGPKEEKWLRERAPKLGEKGFWKKLWKAMMTSNADYDRNDGISYKMWKGISLNEDGKHLIASAQREAGFFMGAIMATVGIGIGVPGALGAISIVGVIIGGRITELVIGTKQKEHRFAKMTAKQRKAALQAVDNVIEIYDDLIDQAKKKGDSDIQGYIYNVRQSWIQDKDEMKRIIANVPKGESCFGFYTEEDLDHHLEMRNSTAAYSENRKFLFNGNIITSSPYEMRNMVKELLSAENNSIRTIGESMNLSEASDQDSIYAANVLHKNVVNQTALILATRNKFGFEY